MPVGSHWGMVTRAVTDVTCICSVVGPVRVAQEQKQTDQLVILPLSRWDLVVAQTFVTAEKPWVVVRPQEKCAGRNYGMH